MASLIMIVNIPIICTLQHYTFTVLEFTDSKTRSFTINVSCISLCVYIFPFIDKHTHCLFLIISFRHGCSCTVVVIVKFHYLPTSVRVPYISCLCVLQCAVLRQLYRCHQSYNSYLCRYRLSQPGAGPVSGDIKSSIFCIQLPNLIFFFVRTALNKARQYRPVDSITANPSRSD